MGPILLVDCDVQSVERLKAQLAELGHTVQVARDAAAATLLADEHTAAIFIDLAMPTLDTHALATRLRAQCTAPLVACVRTLRKIDTVFAVRNRFADWLEKPVSREELKGVLLRLSTERPHAGHAGESATSGKTKSADVLKDIVQMVRDGTISIPQMPQVVLRLRSLLQGADPEPGEVVRLVESDPGLASRITAMAASPAFGPGIDRPTVASAVARLGIRQLQALVETSALTGMFPAPARELAVRFRGKWNELVTSACLSREVAAAVRLESSEAYLLALFQDVGELFLLTVLSRFDGQALDSSPMVQTWHGQFGASLLAKWGMPPSFGLLARHHHDPDFDAIADDGMRQRLHAINLANRLVQAASVEAPAGATGPGAATGPTVDESLRALGLTPPQRERLEARVPDLQREVAAPLGIGGVGSHRRRPQTRSDGGGGDFDARRSVALGALSALRRVRCVDDRPSDTVPAARRARAGRRHARRCRCRDDGDRRSATPGRPPPARRRGDRRRPVRRRTTGRHRAEPASPSHRAGVHHRAVRPDPGRGCDRVARRRRRARPHGGGHAVPGRAGDCVLLERPHDARPTLPPRRGAHDPGGDRRWPALRAGECPDCTRARHAAGGPGELSRRGEPGETFVFDGSSSTDVDGALGAWLFDFGDGAEPAGDGTEPVVEHAFASPGRYDVRLTVIGVTADSDVATGQVDVGGAGLAPRVRLLEPAEGRAVAPGEVVTTVVEVAVADGRPVAPVSGILAGAWAGEVAESLYRLEVLVPAEIAAGERLALVAQARDDIGVVETSAAVHLLVRAE